jgi:hypothetical protein
MRCRSPLLDLAALVFLGLVVLAFFWPLAFGGYWVPRGGGDLVSFIWPMYRFSARSLWSGQIPLWNPYVYAGAPFVADNQSGVFYPINLLVFALFGEPSYAAIEGLVVFHVWLAAAGTYALLRSMGLRRSAAVFGGVAFGLSDLFVTHIGNLNLNATAAWMPSLLWLTHRALAPAHGQRPGQRVGWAMAAGAALAVAALAGHGQMLLFSGVMLVGYIAYRLIVGAASRKGQEARGQRMAKGTRMLSLGLLAALIVLAGVGGAAMALLPAWEMAQHTGRGQLAYEEATRYSLPPKALLGLLAPGFYGRGQVAFWGDWDRVEVGYVGVSTLVFAALGILLLGANWAVAASPSWLATRLPGVRTKLWPRRARSRVPALPGAFFILLAGAGFVLAMGRYTPAYWLLYRFVPTFDQLRVPARMIVLADLGLAALAAYGLHRMPETRLSLWVGLVSVVTGGVVLALGLGQARMVPYDRIDQAKESVIVAAALLGLSGTLMWLVHRIRWSAWLMPLVLAADLIALGSMLEIEPNDPTLGYGHEDVVAFLRQDSNLYRIESSPARAWQPDAALVHGLYDIDGVFNPLGIAPYHAYRWACGGRGSPLHNLMGVKYVLADKDDPPGDERLVPVYVGNPEIDVFLNTRALPMAILVHDAQVVHDHEAAWQAVHAPGFDPTRVVVLEEEHASDGSGATGEGGRIEYIRYDLSEIQLAVDMPAGGWLVLSEVYYPGWRATVDGEQVDVLRANYTFRAIPLSAGEHLVRTWFAPWTWHVGLAVSGVTWMGLAIWAGWALRRRVRPGRMR